MTEKRRLLIVDDDQMMTKTLRDIFMAKGYEADYVHSASNALEKIEKTDFGCVLTDIKMPEMDGVELFREIKKIQPHIPVVLMTAHSTCDRIDEGLREGALGCLTKPLDIETVLCFLSLLHRERSVVIVDDDSVFCKTLGDILQQQNVTVNQVTEPCSIFEKISSNEQQVVLLNMKMNGMDGLDIFKKIRKKYPTKPVILMAGCWQEMKEFVEAALELNAYTYLLKTFQIKDLLECLSEIQNFTLSQTLDPSIGSQVKRGGG